MKSPLAALFLVALLPAPAFGQNACTVDLVFPHGTIELSSDVCYVLGPVCMPNPVGCNYSWDLVEPVTITLVDPPIAYEVLYPREYVAIRSPLPDFAIEQQWFGQQGTLGFNVDEIFTGGFDH